MMSPWGGRWQERDGGERKHNSGHEEAAGNALVQMACYAQALTYELNSLNVFFFKKY